MSDERPNEMKVSAYGYLFNSDKFDFNLDLTVSNFCEFFDEVCCCTLKSDKTTIKKLREFQNKFKNFKIVEEDLDIEKDNRFDGKLKTSALSHCKNELKAIVDFDEIFPISNKEKWNEACRALLESNFDGLLIPSVDLWGDENLIKKSSFIGEKFRLHKGTVVKRGVLKEAEIDGIHFDTSMSDSTEPLLLDGSLANFARIVPSEYLNPVNSKYLKEYPYSLHYGWVDFKRKAEIGKVFWKKHWENRSGHDEDIPTTEEEILEKNIETLRHEIPLK